MLHSGALKPKLNTKWKHSKDLVQFSMLQPNIQKLRSRMNLSFGEEQTRGESLGRIFLTLWGKLLHTSITPLCHTVYPAQLSVTA